MEENRPSSKHSPTPQDTSAQRERPDFCQQDTEQPMVPQVGHLSTAARPASIRRWSHGQGIRGQVLLGMAKARGEKQNAPKIRLGTHTFQLVHK